MSLKVATTLAIVGASVSLALGLAGLVARFVPPLRELIFLRGSFVVAILHALVPASYVAFFVTLSSKQQ